MSDWIEAEPREGSWKVGLPCTREEAYLIALTPDPLPSLDPQPTLMTSEPDPAQPDAWWLDAYFAGEPEPAAVAAVQALVPSAARVKPLLQHIPEEDWVTLSQAGLEPIRAGRFDVRTPAYGGRAAEGSVGFVIEAGRAFGTGHHETTAGCLVMLDQLKRRGARFRDVVDVGTGTGLLALAARHLWPRARIVASDIDPVAIEVARENALVNGVPLGRGRGEVELVAAPGLAHRRLQGRAPYDLIVANILAGPLVALAPAFARALAPGGTLIVAGLLGGQAEAVAAACRRERLRLAGRIEEGDWPTLRFVKPKRGRGGRRRGAAPALAGFGDWAKDGSI